MARHVRGGYGGGQEMPMPFTLQTADTDPHADLDIASEDAVMALWGATDDGDLIRLDELPAHPADLEDP